MMDRCDTCGKACDIDHLDSKPVMTLRLRAIRALFGQERMLEYASDRGYDFTVMECRECYGPGFIEL